MRRSGESPQYHDETPRRRVRRAHSQDLERLHISDMKGRGPEMSENVPTSPYDPKGSPFMLPPSPSSMQNPVSPHRTYPHINLARSQANMPPSPHGSYHSVISPSRYQPGPPLYMPAALSPSSGISTPSCATPASASSTLVSPDFFGHGMGEAPAMSPSKAIGDPGYLIRSPIFTDYQREQFSYPQGPSPGGTIHHHGYNAPHRPPPIPSPTGFPSQPSPGGLTPRSMGGVSSPSSLHPPPSPVYRSHNPGLNPDHSPGNPSGRKHNPVPVGKPADSPETARLRQLVIEYYSSEMENVRGNYHEKLQELFFLQNGGNMMDYLTWKRKPNSQLLNFLNSNQLDDNVLGLMSTAPTSIASAVSQVSQGYVWQQPQDGNVNYAAIQRQVFEQAGLDHQKSLTGNYNVNPPYQKYADSFAPNVSPFTGNQLSPRTLHVRPELSRSISMPNPSTAIHAAGGYGGQHGGNATIPSVSHPTNTLGLNSSVGLHRSISVVGHPLSNGPLNPSAQVKGLVYSKSQSVMSVLDHSFGSQEDIVIEAKREAEVMKRVGELRKEGLWSARRLPKVQEMPRKKAHWDYLLEEMQWLATDFAQERRWKRGVAKKLSRAVLKHHQELKSKEIRAEKEESVRLRRIASSIAREVKQFWASVEKVVQYKIQSRLEEKRKKALDVQLNFIMDQTEKYSSWLVESLKVQPGMQPVIAADSVVSTAPTSPVSSRPCDSEFEPNEESDLEETIQEEETQEGEECPDRQKEIDMLQQDSEMTLEEILENLPPEMLEDRSEESSTDDSDEDSNSGEGSGESNESDIEVDVETKEGENDKRDSGPSKTESTSISKSENGNADNEFILNEDTEEDDEQTLAEQEHAESQEVDHLREIADLEKEGDMPIEELLKIYGTGDDTTDIPTEESSEESSSEDEEATEEESMHFLVKQDEGRDGAQSDPDQQLTNAAATAESLQPTGFTLETAQVQTKVPFLLRGVMREYQVIGLDWLVTMHEKRLNGILADEMGLGKTIQTIALLAHLACDNGIWGPHLIVVPTSVMLNWELEFKKWLPGFKILTYYGSQKERKMKRQGWTKSNAFHVCITSYKLVIQDHQAFRRKKWKYFILDEAQNIKNFKSQRWQYLLNFNSQRRLLLTGTPLQNSLMELWSLMHFLMPHLFHSHKDFKEWFSNPLTGMIEGSTEYNENLVKRLHKVLRPFLLRRLKSEVETQMPKKYEHIIRCSLSKRQRFLYDDFMSRGKTKETLESGHFLSVINILMQLRKVCNHPDLFEARPTVSSLQVEGFVYHTASLVLRALDYDPFNHVNLGYLNLSLADIETTVTSYAAYRTQSLQTPRKLIVEIDSLPETRTHLIPPVKVRRMSGVNFTSLTLSVKTEATNSTHPLMGGYSSVPHSQDHRAFPPVSPLGAPYSSPMWHQDGTAYGRPTASLNLAVQQSRLQGQAHNYMTRHSSGDFVKSPGQHSLGFPKAMPPPPPYPGHSVGFDSYRQHSSLPSFELTGLPVGGGVEQMRRTEHVASTGPQLHIPPQGFHMKSPDQARPEPKLVLAFPAKKLATEKKSESTGIPLRDHRSSPFYLSKMADRKASLRKEKLLHLTVINNSHCLAQPVYGLDLVKAVTVVKNLHGCNWCSSIVQHTRMVPSAIEEIVKDPVERVEEMKEIVNRFVMFVSPVIAPRITMHTFHPPPHLVNKNRLMEENLKQELIPKAGFLHSITRGMTVQFPELRLIQYDCGKLQTLDILLRRLKNGKHRVLIFTQMTKMLDILEKFLNHHGHVYLRLDGSTKVEQRQILMDRFNADYRIFCFILSTRSGGLGVNLTGADTVVFIDSDWNPTMDAQAQDRCHRIGQTRDVHIYRLICERTVEENILKKANQKRMLGDIAIEGGNFTTAFFRETSLKELFNVETSVNFEATVSTMERERAMEKSIENVEKKVEVEEFEKASKIEEEEGIKQVAGKSEVSAERLSQNLFEQALFKAEDEQDACAATRAKAEQAAELAEFDEGIPYFDEAARESLKNEEMSRVEEELIALESQLTPVERFGVRFLETSGAYITLEQIREEEQVELAKKDWEMDHLLAIREEEEKRAAEDDDEILFTYSRADATQVKKSKYKSKSKSASRPNSRCSSRSSDSKKSKRSNCAGSQSLQTVRDSCPSKLSSRSSSRSSSCSSTGMTTRRTKSCDAP